MLQMRVNWIPHCLENINLDRTIAQCQSSFSNSDDRSREMAVNYSSNSRSSLFLPDCNSKDDDDSFADIDEQYILSNYLSAWYNIIQPSACVCVSSLFKQALIFQWLHFGQFTLFQQH